MKLRWYQEEAVRLALQHDGFAILCEQRTGKTPIGVEVAYRRKVSSLLCVCPKIAVPMWKGELSVLPRCEVEVLTFESIYHQRMALRRWKPQMILGDEVHKIKSPTSKRGRGLRLLARTIHQGGDVELLANYRLALTGTPIEGGYEDAWATFDFIDPSVFGSWGEFKSRYLIFGGFKKKKIIGYRNESEFLEKFHSLSYRVLLDDVTPVKAKVRSVKIRFKLEESTRVYREMEKKFVTELNTGERIVAQRVITQAMKLHQITGGHLFPGDGQPHAVGNEKLRALERLLERLTPPLVVFVRFLPEVQAVSDLLMRHRLSVLQIKGGTEFTGFREDAAVVQIQSGVSIDLARASCAIFYSMNRSFLDYEQAKFRIRSYDSVSVTYYYLIAQDTIDEVIFDSQQAKKSLSTAVCDLFRKK